MNEHERLQLWAELEQLLTSVICASAGLISDADRFEAMAFVRVNEFGVAYEWLVAAIQEDGITIPAVLAADLKKAAALMGLSNEVTKLGVDVKGANLKTVPVELEHDQKHALVELSALGQEMERDVREAGRFDDDMT